MADNSIQTTLIIGASSSFGKVISERLFKTGHSLVLTHSGVGEYRPPKGIVGSVMTLDVTDPDAVDSVLSDCDPVNNVVYSVAAPIEFKKFSQESWEDYEAHWQTQVKGLWHVAQALLAHKHPLRRIFVLGSAITNHSMPRLGPYLTAKHALVGLCEALGLELKYRGIMVTQYSPNATGKGLSKDFPRVMLEMEGSFAEKLTPEDIAVDIEKECRQ
ncbi:MAG: SDR family oxidoreductase [Parcubacteria group bacterium]|nr:SDR family oxidoreductase [Parcubacteria group bacterium]